VIRLTRDNSTTARAFIGALSQTAGVGDQPERIGMTRFEPAAAGHPISPT